MQKTTILVSEKISVFPWCSNTVTARWLSNIVDADSIIESFLRQCHEAGPEKCRLYEVSLNTLRTKYFGVLQSLKDMPLPVPAHDQFGPEIITYDNILEVMVDAMYRPVMFPFLARVINDIANGNGKEFAELKQKAIPAACLSAVCERHPWSTACHSSTFVSHGYDCLRRNKTS